MKRLMITMTNEEKARIESFVRERKMAWGLFWRQAIRAALRKSEWSARHARKNKPTPRKHHEAIRQKTAWR